MYLLIKMGNLFEVFIARLRKTIFVKLDAIRSNADPRDFHIGDMFATGELEDIIAPHELDLRKSTHLPVRNQGSQGSCSAHTAAEIKEVQEGIREHFSPQYVYNLRANQNTSGMTARDTLGILLKYGIPFERSFRYNINVNNSPSTRVHNEARNFRIKAYARVDTIEDAKKAMTAYGPLYMAAPVYNSGNRFWAKGPGEVSQGGHATSLVGYNDEGFIVQNHWSSNWNGDGYTILPYEDWPLVWEVWTTIDDESSRFRDRFHPVVENAITSVLDTYFSMFGTNPTVAKIVSIISILVILLYIFGLGKKKD